MAVAGNLLTKTRVVKVKLETEAGTKVAGDTAIYFEDAKLVETSPVIERNGDGAYRGHSLPSVIGERSGKFTGTAEIRGSGSAGCDAGLAILLQCCGLKKTLEVFNMYSTLADDKTVSIDMWQSGRKLGLAGGSGTFVIRGESGGRVLVDFEIDGVWQTPADEAIPAWAPGSQKPFMNKGATFTLDSNAIKISQWTLTGGQIVVPRRSVAAASGISHYSVADMKPMFGCDPEADLVANYDYHGIFAAGTEKAISLIVTNGTDKCTIAIPKFQTTEKNEGDRDGLLTHELNGQCNHSSGNDAITLTFAAA
jgi:hypothetical protein